MAVDGAIAIASIVVVGACPLLGILSAMEIHPLASEVNGIVLVDIVAGVHPSLRVLLSMEVHPHASEVNDVDVNSMAGVCLSLPDFSCNVVVGIYPHVGIIPLNCVACAVILGIVPSVEVHPLLFEIAPGVTSKLDGRATNPSLD